MSIKCLVVDDDVTIAENTAEYFNMFDVPTAYVTGYDETIEFLESNEVSLILLDINLGDRSGFELCKKIREDYDMPIFFISPTRPFSISSSFVSELVSKRGNFRSTS